MAISGGSSVAVLPAPECDTDLVADEMTLLVEAVGDILTSATPRLARIANRDGRSRPC